jgi:predicted Fe-Mo cluster-binding NifX family protein
MIVAIPASDCKIDALTDERFARCPFFCLYDTDTMNVNFIENDKQNALSGVGPQVAELLASNNTGEVYAMEVGPKAQTILSKLNISVRLLDTRKTVQEVIKMLNH